MADADIKRLTNKGSISLWHYADFPRNFCGYHLTADQQGCVFLIGLFERFRKARYPARKKIKLDYPVEEHLAIPNCQKQCIPANFVEFRFRHEDDAEHWSISQIDEIVTIETGLNGLSDLHRGANDMLLADGDWSTGSGTESLWFWRHPKLPQPNKRAHNSTPNATN